MRKPYISHAAERVPLRLLLTRYSQHIRKVRFADFSSPCITAVISLSQRLIYVSFLLRTYFRLHLLLLKVTYDHGFRCIVTRSRLQEMQINFVFSLTPLCSELFVLFWRQHGLLFEGTWALYLRCTNVKGEQAVRSHIYCLKELMP